MVFARSRRSVPTRRSYSSNTVFIKRLAKSPQRSFAGRYVFQQFQDIFFTSLKGSWLAQRVLAPLLPPSITFSKMLTESALSHWLMEGCYTAYGPAFCQASVTCSHYVIVSNLFMIAISPERRYLNYLWRYEEQEPFDECGCFFNTCIVGLTGLTDGHHVSNFMGNRASLLG